MMSPGPAPHAFYSPLSMWGSSFAPPPITPTSSSSSAPSPPNSRQYEEATPQSVTPPHHAYGYPPTPPKDVKQEESHYSGGGILGALGGESSFITKQRPTEGTSSPEYAPSPLATPSFSNGSYSTTVFAKGSKSSAKNAAASTGKHLNYAFLVVVEFWDFFLELLFWGTTFLRNYFSFQRAESAWIVAPLPRLYGDETAMAIICAMLVAFITKWTGKTGL